MINRAVRSFVRETYNRIRNRIRYFGKPIYIHPSTYISPRAVLRVNGGGSIRIGANCEIHDFAAILTYGGQVVFGDNCSLNHFAVAYGHGGLLIGSGVRIGAHTTIIPFNHIPGDEALPLYKRGITSKGIIIADYVWIGAGVRVLDGVEIGPHAIVGAGSVVNRNVASGVTVVGVPARPLPNRHLRYDAR